MVRLVHEGIFAALPDQFLCVQRGTLFKRYEIISFTEIHLDLAGCDITLNVTNTTQYISTQGYPLYQGFNQDCSFNFVAPPGERIVVVFEDVKLELYHDIIIFGKF